MANFVFAHTITKNKNKNKNKNIQKQKQNKTKTKQIWKNLFFTESVTRVSRNDLVFLSCKYFNSTCTSSR